MPKLPVGTIPASSIDLFSDDALRDASTIYDVLRGLGPVVWLEAHGVYALPRYAEVKAALSDARVFRSGDGVGLNDLVNSAAQGTTLMSDDDLHAKLRGYLKPLAPRAVRSLQGLVESRVNELVDRLVDRRTFDAIDDLARPLAMSIAPDLVGWPDDSRQHLLEWGASTFNLMGPMNDRAKASTEAFGEMVDFSKRVVATRNLQPGGAAHTVLDGVDRGDLTETEAAALILDYLAPSLDTTISAIGSMIWLFGRYPDQWQLLRSAPTMIPNAFNEVLRLESPIRFMTRRLSEEISLGNFALAAKSRVMLMFGSANRDEAHWPHPALFDITRDASGHLGFGWGVHGCVGQGLARLEAHALMTALVQRVEAIEVGEPTMAVNNLITALDKLPVTFALRGN